MGLRSKAISRVLAKWVKIYPAQKGITATHLALLLVRCVLKGSTARTSAPNTPLNVKLDYSAVLVS